MSEDKFPRVTEAEFEIWMNSKVTQTYLLGLRFLREQLTEDARPNLDPKSADASHAYLFSVQGGESAYRAAETPMEVLRRSELYEEPTDTGSPDPDS